MDYPMRRSRQAMELQAAEQVLRQGTSGVLALIDPQGRPYAVPLSYVYYQGKLYFHSAKEGRKIQALRANPAASFCVIGQDQVVPQEYTTYYRSVVVEGTLRIVEDPDRVEETIRAFGERYSPGLSLEGEIAQNQGKFLMLELEPEQIRGKESIELVRRREADQK